MPDAKYTLSIEGESKDFGKAADEAVKSLNRITDSTLRTAEAAEKTTQSMSRMLKLQQIVAWVSAATVALRRLESALEGAAKRLGEMAETSGRSDIKLMAEQTSLLSSNWKKVKEDVAGAAAWVTGGLAVAFRAMNEELDLARYSIKDMGGLLATVGSGIQNPIKTLRMLAEKREKRRAFWASLDVHQQMADIKAGRDTTTAAGETQETPPLEKLKVGMPTGDVLARIGLYRGSDEAKAQRTREAQVSELRKLYQLQAQLYSRLLATPEFDE